MTERISTLHAEGLRFSYPGGEPVYDGFSLDAASNERVALTGPSGAGKTTLCQLLAGYIRPAEGKVWISDPDGTTMINGARRELRRGRGRKVQDRNVRDSRTRSSLLRAATPCPVQLIGQHPESALDPMMRMEASLKEAGDADPYILEQLCIRHEWLRRYPHELSGGEMQRFCIARALLAKPRFIIADEITTMLDAVSQSLVWHVLLEYAAENNAGIVFVTHSESLRSRIATRSIEV